MTAPKSCGTAAGFLRHKRLHQRPCSSCIIAWENTPSEKKYKFVPVLIKWNSLSLKYEVLCDWVTLAVSRSKLECERFALSRNFDIVNEDIFLILDQKEDDSV